MVENVEMEAREPIKDDRLPGPSSNTPSVRREHADVLLRVITVRRIHMQL